MLLYTSVLFVFILLIDAFTIGISSGWFFCACIFFGPFVFMWVWFCPKKSTFFWGQTTTLFCILELNTKKSTTSNERFALGFPDILLVWCCVLIKQLAIHVPGLFPQTSLGLWWDFFDLGIHPPSHVPPRPPLVSWKPPFCYNPWFKLWGFGF